MAGSIHNLHNFLIAINYPVDDIDPIFLNKNFDFDEDLDDFVISYEGLQRGEELRNTTTRYVINN